MQTRTIIFATLILAATAFALAAGPGLASGDRGQQVRKIFEGSIDPRGPGCAVSIARGGVVEFEDAWGLADINGSVPNWIGTIFEAGSVSKQFTAAAVAVLVAQGRLALDDDVRRYVPEMRTYGRPITVRMLLTHTSGIRNWDDLVELAGRPREDASGLSQADALAIILRQSELNFPPGEEYLYSNSNYVLAASIVERVSGEPFPSFSKRAVFAPAGMSHTQWRDDYRRPVPGRATAYTPSSNGVLDVDMPEESVIGPGGLLTTIGDLQRWNALLERPESAAARWVHLLTQTRGALVDGTPIRYGLGLEFDQLRGHEIISHAGATAGYRGYLARVPDQKLSAAVLCNAGAVNTEDAGPEFLSLFIAPGASPASAGAVLGSAPPDLAGRYQNLRTRALVTASIDGTGVHFNGGTGFREVAPGRLVNGEGSRSLSVERNAEGLVRRLVLTRIGNAPAILVPVAAWAPTAAALANFTGSYVSDDVGVLWRISFDGGVLRASGPRGETFLLDPIYQDAFNGRDTYWTLEFARDGAGRVDRIRFYKTRTLGVAFRRVSQ